MQSRGYLSLSSLAGPINRSNRGSHIFCWGEGMSVVRVWRCVAGKCEKRARAIDSENIVFTLLLGLREDEILEILLCVCPCSTSIAAKRIGFTVRGPVTHATSTAHSATHTNEPGCGRNERSLCESAADRPT